jgi:hypothetical protein
MALAALQMSRLESLAAAGVAVLVAQLQAREFRQAQVGLAALVAAALAAALPRGTSPPHQR